MSPARVLVAAVLGVVLTACGADTSPGEAVPALAKRLDQVDAAVTDGDPAAVRRAVDALVRETDDAEAAGDVSSEQADRIRAAADGLLERLPDGAPTSPDTGTPAPVPTPEPETDPGEEEAPGKSDHPEDHGPGHGKDHGPEGKGHGSEH